MTGSSDRVVRNALAFKNKRLLGNCAMQPSAPRLGALGCTTITGAANHSLKERLLHPN